MLVFFANEPRGPSALRVTRDRIDAAFAGRANLLDGIEIEIGGADAWTAHAHRADILFMGHLEDPLGWKNAEKLKWVQSTSAGVEALSAELPGQIQLTNASGVHADKGAEFIVASVLMLNFGIPRFVDDKQHKRWQPKFGSVLNGKRVTLLGTGAIGSAAARLLRLHGAFVTGVNRLGRADGFDAVVSIGALDSVLDGTDFLVSTLPLTPQTTGLIGADRLSKLPERAGVVVVGRSLVFDYAALRRALEEGRLSGAVLDVFDEEPIPTNDPLWDCPGLIITPHCSLDDHESYLDRCLGIFADNLERLRSGRPLMNRVDRRLGY